jgi:perosamine synthetase
MSVRTAIPLSRPDITDLERRYVSDVMNTDSLSLGPVLPRFEKAFAAYMGMKHAVAVNSGTSGLHLAMKAAGVGEGDAVITTPFSFIASANSILFERARPVFVDIDADTYNMDAAGLDDAVKGLVRKGERVRAILPVHVFGQPCDMDTIMKVARAHSIEVIEDACEAVGSEYRGRKAGTFGRTSVFAFYPNKQMTTGEGGMIVTDDDEAARLMRSMRNQGRAEGGAWLAHERLGYNYRLSEINCALGVAQLERLDGMIKRRSIVASMYNERLKGVEGLILPGPVGDVLMSWFVYVVRLADEYTREERDGILKGLRDAGIGCNNYFTPIHLQPFYREDFGYREGDFPVTERVSARTIALPFFNNLTAGEIDYVAGSLERLVSR